MIKNLLFFIAFMHIWTPRALSMQEAERPALQTHLDREEDFFSMLDKQIEGLEQHSGALEARARLLMRQALTQEDQSGGAKAAALAKAFMYFYWTCAVKCAGTARNFVRDEATNVVLFPPEMQDSSFTSSAVRWAGRQAHRAIAAGEPNGPHAEVRNFAKAIGVIAFVAVMCALVIYPSYRVTKKVAKKVFA